jgi:dihydroneopterin aldolase
LSLCVAKLGGSLSDSPLRAAWLDAFAAARSPLILVPGGGPHARAVRAAQLRAGFDDAAAHVRALVAMERFGAALAGHSDRFVLASSRRNMAAAQGAGKIVVWLPSAMARAASEIPASWDMTSDSLAAWLAGEMGADRLLLVKSCDVAAPVSLAELARAKIVDPLFARFAARSGAAVYVAGPCALADAAEVFHTGGVPGAPVAPGISSSTVHSMTTGAI